MSEPYRIQGNTGAWEVVIGLEVHAQITSESKLFSGAANDFGAEPNHNVSFIDAAMPGMLPVINAKCVEQAVRTGLGLNAQINLRSVFDRKNYFYADLPQGYQISQYLDPIVGKGEMVIDLADGSSRTIGITRLHVEQDAGKSLHETSPTSTFIDLNRAGVALMEIVSEPDMRSPEEAGAYVKKLRAILRYLGTCDGDMEKGSMRCDANVSVRKPGAEYGTRCEIKNVNSIRNVMRAIEVEATRQVELVESGGKVVQQTRLYDAAKNETRSMRSKEDAQDYRYFPDPDLLPLELTQEFVDAIKKTLPELPDQKKKRYIEGIELPTYDASVLVSDKAIASYFERTIADWEPIYGGNYAAARAQSGDNQLHKKLAATAIANDVLGLLNKENSSIEEFEVRIPSNEFQAYLALVIDATINGKIAKSVLPSMFETGKGARQIVEEEGLVQVTDTGAIEKVIDEVFAANPDKLAEYRSGKDKLFGFFVGQVMKASGGKANPGVLNDLLKAKLQG